MVCTKNHPSRFFLPRKSSGKNIVEFYIEKKLFSHRKKVVFVQKKDDLFSKKRKKWSLYKKEKAPCRKRR